MNPVSVKIPSQSSGELYEVSFFLDKAGKLKASCSCPATTMCKHLRAILSNEFDGVIFEPSTAQDLIAFLQTDFFMSDFGAAFREYQAAMEAYEQADKLRKKKADAVKKFLQVGY